MDHVIKGLSGLRPKERPFMLVYNGIPGVNLRLSSQMSGFGWPRAQLLPVQHICKKALDPAPWVGTKNILGRGLSLCASSSRPRAWSSCALAGSHWLAGSFLGCASKSGMRLMLHGSVALT
jgi:hypothetical protein